jgi:murein DD-endopeptidase MepM/ murein hydrolase activator NlpD
MIVGFTQRILSRYLPTSVIVLVLCTPVLVSANVYTLPIDEEGDSDIEYTAWFDHNTISSEMVRNDGGEYSGAEASSITCSNYNGGAGCYDNHHGIDFGTTITGKDVYAADDGDVVGVGWENPYDEEQGYGFRVYLYHDDQDQRTVYAHLASTTQVALNDALDRGDILGTSSSTGISSGPHLHFGVYDGNTTATTSQLDPFGWQGAGTDPWPYNTNEYLWTTNPPSFDEGGGSYATTTVSGTISSDETWEDGYIYLVTSSGIAVAPGVTLTIEPGVIVKLTAPGSDITVSGTLDVNGTANNPVYFTSLRDDTVGGDTNGDGTSTTPAAENWEHIKIASGGTANIEYVIMRYGGAGAYDTTMYNTGGNLTIASSTINNGYRYGIRQDSGTTTIAHTEITDHIYGIHATGGVLGILFDNSFHNNTSYGVYNTTGTTTAEYNYWGDASGPYHSTLNPSGTGDAVSDDVGFAPWLTSWP